MFRLTPYLIALSFLTACNEDPRDTQRPAAHYVAMGSSFAAGPGLTPRAAGSPTRCWQSAKNYAHLLADKMDFNLTDMSCSGATTHHILGPWNELPAQISAVGAGTALVTITIGGNDINYIGGLIAASCQRLADEGKQTQKCFTAPQPTKEDFVAVEQQLKRIATEVHARAPQARVIFVNYFSVLPEGPPCENTPLSARQAEAFLTLGKRLERITARAAEASGADILDAAALTRNHHACAADPWITGYRPDPDWALQAPYHAKQQAMTHVADALAALLSNTKSYR